MILFLRKKMGILSLFRVFLDVHTFTVTHRSYSETDTILGLRHQIVLHDTRVQASRILTDELDSVILNQK